VNYSVKEGKNGPLVGTFDEAEYSFGLGALTNLKRPARSARNSLQPKRRGEASARLHDEIEPAPA
jgi:hypothetical protein